MKKLLFSALLLFIGSLPSIAQVPFKLINAGNHHTLIITEPLYQQAYPAHPDGWMYNWYISVDGGIVKDGVAPIFYTNNQNITVTLQLTRKRDGGLPPALFVQNFNSTHPELHTHSSGVNVSDINHQLASGDTKVSLSRNEVRAGDSIIYYHTFKACDTTAPNIVSFSYNSSQLEYIRSFTPNSIIGPISIHPVNPIDPLYDMALTFTAPSNMLPHTVASYFRIADNASSPATVRLKEGPGDTICSEDVLPSFVLPEGVPYDPNDKFAQPRVLPLFIANGSRERILFTICFQNEGTAPTKRIDITDQLPPYFKIKSSDFVGSSFDNENWNTNFTVSPRGSGFTWCATSKRGGPGLNGTKEFPIPLTPNQLRSTIGYIQFYVHLVEDQVVPSGSCTCLKNEASITFAEADTTFTVEGKLGLEKTTGICKGEPCIQYPLWFHKDDMWWPYKYRAVVPPPANLRE